MSDQNRPVVQVKQETPFYKGVENLTLEGNQVRPLTSYVRVWEDVLTPPGGVEAMLLQGLLYTAGIAFCVTLNSWAQLALLVWCSGYILGGLIAVVLEPKLMAPYTIRLGMIALGFVITLI